MVANADSFFRVIRESGHGTVSLGRFGDRRLEKDPMRVDGGLTW
jgi:hypothetical protein